ncbi:hypothetical protein GGI12_000983 [Dipsacomyces acuminosporus]|nr:hypothetical protein GGI12_000983 [Dipsacomyces acuminosporus]
MGLEVQTDDIRASLKKHAQAIDGLLRLVAPKFYMPEINEEIINKRYMKNTKHDSDSKKKSAERKTAAQIRAARLDPDNHKTVQELQAEKLKKQIEEKEQEQGKTRPAKKTKTGNEKRDEIGGPAMAKLDVDLDGGAELDKREQAVGVPEIQPMKSAGSISELRERLHERIGLLRAKRKAPEDDTSREKLLAKRRKKVEETKAKQKKKGAKAAQEQVLGSKTPGGASGAGKANGSNGSEVKDSIFYGTLTTGAAKKKKSINAKQQLAKVENEQKELKELKMTDADKAAKLEEKNKWGKAFDLAKGEKVRDDPKLLRKTIRRAEQQKKKSSREWNDRKNAVEAKKKERADKREANIKARVDAKKMKKQGKSKKSIERVLKANKAVKIKGLYGLPKSRTAVTPDVVSSVAQYFRQHQGKVLAVTGAGVSTLSGIPDYRGSSGTYRVHGEYLPILHHELVTQHASRQRYWARSFFGIRPAFKAEPNIIHHTLAELEHSGQLSGLITQNVDGLHSQAGSHNVLELHGTLKNVKCLSCGQIESRDEFQGKLEQLNPDWAAFWQAMVDTGAEPSRRPDGDVDLPSNLRYEDFKYPMCGSCQTGHYMPTVVFFGGNVDEQVRDRSFWMVNDSEALFICGTSLATFSAYRLVRHARESGKPVVILNFGETRADKDATLKIEAHAEELLPLLARSLLGSNP